MSIFGAIKDAIFGHKAATPATTTAAPAANPAPATATSTVSSAPVDVDATLAQMAKESGQKLNYQTSIVDLLKLLNIDSSLAAREQLATDVGYTGPKDGSAEMNIALHKAVMQRLAGDGAKVSPALQGG